MNFKSILLSNHKAKPHVIQLHLYEMSRQVTFLELESRLVVAWDWSAEPRLIVNVHEGSY